MTSNYLITQSNDFVCSRIVLRRIGILTVAQLDLGVVFDLIQEHDPPVRQKSCVHRRDARLTYNIERARIGRGRGRRWTRRRNNSSANARPTLTTIATMGSRLAAKLREFQRENLQRKIEPTTHSVQRATTSLRPVTTDRVAVIRSAGSVCCDRTRRGCICRSPQDRFCSSGTCRRGDRT